MPISKDNVICSIDDIKIKMVELPGKNGESFLRLDVWWSEHWETHLPKITTNLNVGSVLCP